MSDSKGKVQGSLMEQLMNQFMEEQLNEPSEDKKGMQNSLIFLENRTVNLLIISMLMNQERQTHAPNLGNVGNSSQTEILASIDQLIADSKQEFEEILTLLKEK